MSNRELNDRLARAIGHAAPDDFEDVISRSDRPKGDAVHMTPQPKKKLRIAAIAGAVAACLALALAGGWFYYDQTGAVASVISLDVNPSIELTINKNEKVLSCTPMNEEATLALADMDGGADLKGTNVAVAVNAIVGALARCGYLDDISSAILLTVEDNNEQRAARLQTELSGITHTALLAQSSNADIINQTLTVDAGREQLAHQNNISSGKAALIYQVMAQNSSLQFDALATLTVNELRDLSQSGAPGMPIGKTAAIKAAEAYAGTAALSSATADANAELDKTPAHYAVEIATAFGEFEYMVDAYTGEILKGLANVLSVSQGAQDGDASSSAPAQPENTDPTAPAQPENTDPTAPSQSGNAGAATPAQPGNTGSAAPAQPGNTGSAAPAQPGNTGSAAPAQPGNTGSAAPAQPGNTGSAAPAQPANPPTQNTSAFIGLEAAKGAALSHAGVSEADTHYCNCWLDYEDHRPAYYEVEFMVGNVEYEYEIDLYSGAVLKYETEQRSPTGSQTPPSGGSSADIGQDAAKQAAFAHAGLSESQVTHLKVKRDHEDGRLEYEVEFKYNGIKYEYDIDAATGNILKYKYDD